MGSKLSFFSSCLKKRIDNSKIVSFDIFDTLLVRPYVRPTDLFVHMERALECPGFADERTAAERRARINHPELQDITLDMIYDEIDGVFKGMKQHEMDWEEMVLRANPEMKQVYDYAKAHGKKVVIASDMYLPTEFIAKVLRKNGYDNWDALYVSGELNKTKGHGSLWPKILKDANVQDAKEILHIGDNDYSDCKIPKKHCISVAKYTPLLLQYKYSSCRYKKLKTKSLGASILMGIMSYKWALDRFSGSAYENYWVGLGWYYAGPVGYAYTRFVEQTAKNNKIDALLFVARDGYLLQSIFNSFATGIKSAYVYAPRFVNHICRLDYVKDNKIQAQAIIDFYRQNNPEIKELFEPFDNPCSFISDNKKILAPLADKKMQIYRDYLMKNIPVAKKYALVDTITGAFSSQKTLQGALKESLLGIYWGVSEDLHVHKYRFDAFIGKNTPSDITEYHRMFTRNWNFMEFLITSPEYPILNIDQHGNPVHALVQSPYEIERAALYPFIEQGALEFVSYLNNWFNNHDIYLSSQDIKDWVNGYINKPTRYDINNMKGIHFGEDSQHKHWIPLFVSRIKFMDFIKHPKRIASMIKLSVWRTPAQSLMICLYKPVSVRIRKLRFITITVFPGLIKRYFTFLVGNEKICQFRFTVGNIKDDV